MDDKTVENDEKNSNTLIDTNLKSLNNLNEKDSKLSNPQIGCIYSVQRIDGIWLPAEILEKRELKGKPVEYFIHFENCKQIIILIQVSINLNFLFYIYIADKRLDEWAGLERFDLTKGELTKCSQNDTENSKELSERKMTRNQKRKSESISNVY
jgi:hypothetical protein